MTDQAMAANSAGEAGDSLKKGALYLTIGNVLQAVVAFAVNLVLVRYVSPEEFGRFALIFAEASLIFAFFSLRVNVLIIRASEAAFTDDLQCRYFSALFWETICATAIMIGWSAVTGTLDLWSFSLILAIGLRHWVQVDRVFFERRMPYVRYALVETGSALVAHVLSLVLVLAGVGWQALFWREIALSVFGLLGLILIGALTLRRVRWLSFSEWRSIFRDARGIWVDGALDASFQRLSLLLAGYVGGDAVAGYLFQAQRLAGLPMMVLAPISNRISANWFARTTDGTHRRAGRTRVLMWMFGVLGIGCLLTIMFADPVVPWMLGENWRPVMPLLVILTGYILFASPFEVMRGYCLAVRQARWLVPARLVQHVALIAPLGLINSGILDVGGALAAGISMAYLLGYIVLFALLRRAERSEK